MGTSPIKFFRSLAVCTQNDWSSDFIPHGLLRARQEPLEAARTMFPAGVLGNVVCAVIRPDTNMGC